MEIVAVDVGGTHARFAVARIDGGAIHLTSETVFRTSDYPGLGDAWRAYGLTLGRDPPRAAAIAIAAPIDGDRIAMTNNNWVFHASDLAQVLDIDAVTIVNDFAAVARAVSQCDAGHFRHLCGPDIALPSRGPITIIGPGTGLGVAILYRGPAVDLVIATEGGHIDFAPVDEIDERILASLQVKIGRVSVERIVSGPGLSAIHDALFAGAQTEGDHWLWAEALAGSNTAATAALDRFCMILGSVAGDLALAHGAGAVVVAGGLGLRLAETLPRSGFAERFIAKGRYRDYMAAIPVRILIHEQPGLLGAAAAFAAERRA